MGENCAKHAGKLGKTWSEIRQNLGKNPGATPGKQKHPPEATRPAQPRPRGATDHSERAPGDWSRCPGAAFRGRLWLQSSLRGLQWDAPPTTFTDPYSLASCPGSPVHAPRSRSAHAMVLGSFLLPSFLPSVLPSFRPSFLPPFLPSNPPSNVLFKLARRRVRTVSPPNARRPL